MTEPFDPDQDVPYGEDLQSPAGAKAWADAAERKRPRRVEFRNLIVEYLQTLAPGSRVLELGSGPGFLAQHVLECCPELGSYTLFDFSEPMLEISRSRAGQFPAASFVLGDFKSDDWPRMVSGPFQAVVSMQAVHEVRHKRHVPRLYRQVYGSIAPSGLFLVCDRTPEDDSPRSASLFMTEHEQVQAMRAAGFADVRVLMSGDALALCHGRKPA